MSVDIKIRIGLLLASLVISALAALASTHGLYVGFLDGIGGSGPH
ncbi:MAG TPA: hypothetical protein VGR53_09580 [Nitrososphaerales archaeon]|nr:hypothetical protein [Nitrososphaerales archaeon]